MLYFYNATTNDLHATAREGPLDAAFVIDTLDAWATTCTRPTVLVLDNAKIHHRATFQARLQHWEDQDVHILYLTTYSPHLNKIETLWRKINYEWLRPEAYLNFCSTLLFFNYLIYSCSQLFSSRKVPLLPV